MSHSDPANYSGGAVESYIESPVFSYDLQSVTPPKTPPNYLRHGNSQFKKQSSFNKGGSVDCPSFLSIGRQSTVLPSLTPERDPAALGPPQPAAEMSPTALSRTATPIADPVKNFSNAFNVFSYPYYLRTLPPASIPSTSNPSDLAHYSSLCEELIDANAAVDQAIPPQLQPGIDQRPKCRYYSSGRCHYGVYCRFSHKLDWTEIIQWRKEKKIEREKECPVKIHS